MLYRSYGNDISRNTLLNNFWHIELCDSDNNTVSFNTMSDGHEGIWLLGSCRNSIFGNTVSNNERGIGLSTMENPPHPFTSNNTIFHNTLINNTNQAFLMGIPLSNAWDDGYPSGGNFWSDHVCTGNPSDGSQPYIIDENNIDHYPFQDQNGWLLHQLTVTSSPITGITFTIDGVPQTTPYTGWLFEGFYTLEMPETYNGYVWSYWLEDGDTNRIKTINLPGTIWTAVYEIGPVGGATVSIDSKGLSSWIASTLLLVSIVVVSSVYIKHKRNDRATVQG